MTSIPSLSQTSSSTVFTAFSSSSSSESTQSSGSSISSEKSKQDIQFQKTKDGYIEIHGLKRIIINPPYKKEPILFGITVQESESTYPMSLIGRVALADELPLAQTLLGEDFSLPLQSEFEPYSAFHWALRAPGDKVAQYILEKSPYVPVCNFDFDKDKEAPRFCETCIPRALKIVEKMQKNKELPPKIAPRMKKMRDKLLVAQEPYLIQQLKRAWIVKDIEQIKRCLREGKSFSEEMLGNLLVEGIKTGFIDGITLLLDKDPSLVNYHIRDPENAYVSGVTALHLAAAASNDSLCELLISRGANPKAKTVISGDPWEEGFQKPGQTYLDYGIDKRFSRALDSMVNYVNSSEYALEEQIHLIVAHWLALEGIDVNLRLCRGKNALELLIKEYSIFAPGKERLRSEKRAIRTLEVVDFLLSLGSDPGLQNTDGINLLDWIRNPSNPDDLLDHSYTLYVDEYIAPYFQKIFERMEAAAHLHAKSVNPIKKIIIEYLNTSEIDPKHLTQSSICLQEIFSDRAYFFLKI